jgi:hypothetical protein
MFITQNLVSWVKSWAGVGSPRRVKGLWQELGVPGRSRVLGGSQESQEGGWGGLGWELRVPGGWVEDKKNLNV